MDRRRPRLTVPAFSRGVVPPALGPEAQSDEECAATQGRSGVAGGAAGAVGSRSVRVVAALCRVRAALAGVALVALALLPEPAAAAFPDDLEAVLALVSEGRDTGARAALDALLECDPARPYGRLLDGVLLVREGRAAEVAAVLEALRRDRPDIPETYNNLAVLYGAEGRLRV